MADTFDPYRKWLGIPPEEQPPHYYRLLAISAFESDPDVISNAADGRMSQVKSYQAGPHARLSQQILNQIAAAKVCLLDPQKKAAYDRRLREKLQATEFDLSSLAAASSSSADHGYMVPVIPKKKKPISWLAPAIVAGAVVLAGSAAAVVFMLPPQGGQVASEGKKPPSPPAPLPGHHVPMVGEGSNLPKSAFNPAAASNELPPKPPVQPPAQPPVQPAVETPVQTPVQAEWLEIKPAADPDSKPAVPAESKPEPKANEKRVAMVPAKKLPVPPDDRQQAIESQVREIFKNDFAAAKTADMRSALAGKLADQAGKSDSDPSATYVLCKLAAQEYAAAGNAGKAMEIVDTIAGRYDIDAARLKLDILTSALGGRDAARPGVPRPATAEPDIAHDVCEAALTLTEAAVTAGDAELAGQFIRVASTAAYRSKDTELERESAKKTREIDALKLRFAAFQKALDTLQTDPADLDANLKAGQWMCFVKGQWDQGLPMLAKGSSQTLAELARQDLAAPGDPKQQVALADAWWNLGEKESSANKTAIEGRARHWYQQAVDKTSGLDKARIQKRLQEETALARPTWANPRAANRSSTSPIFPLSGRASWRGNRTISQSTASTCGRDSSCFRLPSPAQKSSTSSFCTPQAKSRSTSNRDSRADRSPDASRPACTWSRPLGPGVRMESYGRWRPAARAA